MKSYRFLLLSISLGALLFGCATVPEIPSEEDYQPPAPSPAAASLKGCRLNEGGLFGEVHTGYVYMIDLKSVRDAREGWDKPIALTPGKHAIMAEYRFSNFNARANLALTTSAGNSYQLMIKHGRENTTEVRLFCEFWIVDLATGKAVTPVYRAQVMGGKKGTIFNVPT